MQLNLASVLPPGGILTNSTAFAERQQKTVLHELTHAMVFHDALFNYFLDANMNRRPYLGVVGVDPMGGHGRGDRNYDQDWNNIGYGCHTSEDCWPYYILSPKVLEVARNHFDCQEMIGVPLEITGEEGQSRLHWEKTVMGNDYMTA